MPLIDHRQRAWQSEPGNEAAAYGVSLSEQVYDTNRREYVDLQPGQTYYEAIMVYHLTGAENRGGHYIYLDLIRGEHEADGPQPIHCQHCIEFNWEGSDIQTLTPDKNWQFEPMGNLTMFGGAKFVMWVRGSFPSRVVLGLTATHPDEGPGNTIGHHSFYVIWRRQVWQGTGEPDPPDPPDRGAAFLPEPDEGKAPMRLQLNDFSTGDPVAWHWTITRQGNGVAAITSDKQHPEVTLTQPGTYNIVLEVTYADGVKDDAALTVKVLPPDVEPIPLKVGTFEIQHTQEGRGVISAPDDIYRDKSPDWYGHMAVAMSAEAMRAWLSDPANADKTFATFYVPVNRMTRMQSAYIEETPERD